MGWNSVNVVKPSAILEDIPTGSHFYFVHSYYPEPAEEVAATTTDYGLQFVSALEKDNVFACQFHPEKSQRVGLQLLRNFITLCDS
jgi:glutamine amidotransferase